MFNRYARTAAASSVLLLVAGVAVAQVGAGQVAAPMSPVPAVQVVGVDDNPSADDLAGDISGPCDEAEHVADDRCAAGVVEGDGQVHRSDDIGDDHRGGGLEAGVDDNPSADDPAGDISGPCDEVEHAGEPRCGGSGVNGADSTTSTTIDDSTSTTVDDSTTSTTIDDSTSTTLDDSTTSTTIDSTTSTTIDDSTSTTVDDHDDDGDDDDEDNSGKGRGGDDD